MEATGGIIGVLGVLIAAAALLRDATDWTIGSTDSPAAPGSTAAAPPTPAPEVPTSSALPPQALNEPPASGSDEDLDRQGIASSPDPVTIDVQIELSDFGRVSTSTNTFQLMYGGKTYPLNYSWVTSSNYGDVNTRDCDVVTKIVRKSDGSQVGSTKRSATCSRPTGYLLADLPPGDYTVVVDVTHQGATDRATSDVKVVA